MSWNVSEAKARLSEVLARARHAPQVIENRGEPVAVVLSRQEYDRLQQQPPPQPSAMAELLALTDRLKQQGDLELELPARELELTARPRSTKPLEGTCSTPASCASPRGSVPRRR